MRRDVVLLLNGGGFAYWSSDRDGRAAARDFERRSHRVVVAYSYGDGAWFDPAGRFCPRVNVDLPSGRITGLYGGGPADLEALEGVVS